MRRCKRRCTARRLAVMWGNLAAGFLLVCVLGSCIGMSSDITIRRDGSGVIKQEYRISRTLDSLGELEGNGQWPTVPVGKADFERTVARIQGMKMTSFTTKMTDKDVIYRMTLEFPNTDALLRFLDAAGQGASLTRENGKNRLSLTLNDGKAMEPEMAALARQSCEGYPFKLGFSLPAGAELVFRGDGDRGMDTPPVGEASVQGGKAAFSSDLGDLIAWGEKLVMEIRW